MATKPTSVVIEKILSNITELVPEYLNDPADKAVSNGGSGVCIIEQD